MTWAMSTLHQDDRIRAPGGSVVGDHESSSHLRKIFLYPPAMSAATSAST
jgi:hypothetical protein